MAIPWDLWEMAEAVVAVGSACEVHGGLQPTPPAESRPAELFAISLSSILKAVFISSFASYSERIVDLKRNQNSEPLNERQSVWP